MNNNEIETLPEEFTKAKFTYTQIDREGDIAVYERMEEGLTMPLLDYECIIIITTDGKEYYPGASNWGSKGWTYPEYEEALIKFEELKAGNLHNKHTK